MLKKGQKLIRLNKYFQDMMNKIIDSHCHLDFDDFKNDRKEVIDKAIKTGISNLLTISVDLEKFRNILNIAKQYPDIIWCTTGIHPNKVKSKISEREFEEIFFNIENNILNNKNEVIGVGETGLDYFRSNKNKINQQKSFDLHLEVSGKTGCPVVVHMRSAEKDTTDILNKKVKHYNSKGLIHCFTSTKEFAKIALDNDFFISFAGIITFKNSYDLKKVVEYIPNDKILVETDSPYLSPEPLRGKRNIPSNIIHTIKSIAEIKNMAEEEVVSKTNENFFNLFSNILK